MGSEKMALPNKEDLKSLGMNTLIYGAGQAFAYALPLIPSVINFGVWTPVIGLALGVVLKYVNKWVSDNTKPI